MGSTNNQNRMGTNKFHQTTNPSSPNINNSTSTPSTTSTINRQHLYPGAFRSHLWGRTTLNGLAGTGTGTSTPTATPTVPRHTVNTINTVSNTTIPSDEPEAPSLSLGERVVWVRDWGPEIGTVRWIGRLPPVSPDWSVGVEFDKAISTGNGKFGSKQYFITKPNHAVFLPIMTLLRAQDFNSDSSISRSFPPNHGRNTTTTNTPHIASNNATTTVTNNSPPLKNYTTSNTSLTATNPPGNWRECHPTENNTRRTNNWERSYHGVEPIGSPHVHRSHHHCCHYRHPSESQLLGQGQGHGDAGYDDTIIPCNVHSCHPLPASASVTCPGASGVVGNAPSPCFVTSTPRNATRHKSVTIKETVGNVPSFEEWSDEELTKFPFKSWKSSSRQSVVSCPASVGPRTILIAETLSSDSSDNDTKGGKFKTLMSCFLPGQAYRSKKKKKRKKYVLASSQESQNRVSYLTASGSGRVNTNPDAMVATSDGGSVPTHWRSACGMRNDNTASINNNGSLSCSAYTLNGQPCLEHAPLQNRRNASSCSGLSQQGITPPSHLSPCCYDSEPRTSGSHQYQHHNNHNTSLSLNPLPQTPSPRVIEPTRKKKPPPPPPPGPFTPHVTVPRFSSSGSVGNINAKSAEAIKTNNTPRNQFLLGTNFSTSNSGNTSTQPNRTSSFHNLPHQERNFAISTPPHIPLTPVMRSTQPRTYQHQESDLSQIISKFTYVGNSGSGRSQSFSTLTKASPDKNLTVEKKDLNPGLTNRVASAKNVIETNSVTISPHPRRSAKNKRAPLPPNPGSSLSLTSISEENGGRGNSNSNSSQKEQLIVMASDLDAVTKNQKDNSPKKRIAPLPPALPKKTVSHDTMTLFGYFPREGGTMSRSASSPAVENNNNSQINNEPTTSPSSAQLEEHQVNNSPEEVEQNRKQKMPEAEKDDDQLLEDLIAEMNLLSRDITEMNLAKEARIKKDDSANVVISSKAVEVKLNITEAAPSSGNNSQVKTINESKVKAAENGGLLATGGGVVSKPDKDSKDVIILNGVKPKEFSTPYGKKTSTTASSLYANTSITGPQRELQKEKISNLDHHKKIELKKFPVENHNVEEQVQHKVGLTASANLSTKNPSTVTGATINSSAIAQGNSATTEVVEKSNKKFLKKKKKDKNKQSEEVDEVSEILCEIEQVVKSKPTVHDFVAAFTKFTEKAEQIAANHSSAMAAAAAASTSGTSGTSGTAAEKAKANKQKIKSNIIVSSKPISTAATTNVVVMNASGNVPSTSTTNVVLKPSKPVSGGNAHKEEVVKSLKSFPTKWMFNIKQDKKQKEAKLAAAELEKSQSKQQQLLQEHQQQIVLQRAEDDSKIGASQYLEPSSVEGHQEGISGQKFGTVPRDFKTKDRNSLKPVSVDGLKESKQLSTSSLSIEDKENRDALRRLSIENKMKRFGSSSSLNNQDGGQAVNNGVPIVVTASAAILPSGYYSRNGTNSVSNGVSPSGSPTASRRVGNSTCTGKPPLPFKSLSEMEEAKSSNLFAQLEAAIARGQHGRAAALARELAMQKTSNSTLNRIKRQEAQDEKNITVSLYIEDKSSHHGPIPLNITPAMTVKMLKEHVEKELNFAFDCQRWILGKSFAVKDHSTLLSLDICTPGCPVFLYIVAPPPKIAVEKDPAAEDNDENNTKNPGDEAPPTTGAMAPESPNNIAPLAIAPIAPIINDNTVNPGTVDSSTPKPINMNASSRIENGIVLEEIAGTTEQSNNIERNNIVKKYADRNNAELLTERTVSPLREEIVVANQPAVIQPEMTSEKILNVVEIQDDDAEDDDDDDDDSFEYVEVMEDLEDDEIIGLSTELPEFSTSPESEPDKVSIESEENNENAEAKQNYQQLVQLEEQDLITNVEHFECPICFAEFEENLGVVLRECLHTFCKECLSKSVEYSEDAVIKCPFRNHEYSCDSHLTEREIKALVSPALFDKHLQRSMSLAESQAANSFHCKSPDCPGWCLFEDNVNLFLCPVCGIENCLTCGAIHEGKDCRQYQDELEYEAALSEDAKKTKEYLDNMVKEGQAMHCPTCRVIVMKKWGCDWLKCSVCQTEICWVTKGPRWGPEGRGDTSAGCKCGIKGVRCHPLCNYCH